MFPNLKTIDFADNAYFVAENDVVYSEDKTYLKLVFPWVTELTIPASVNMIDRDAISDSWQLRRVTFEEGSALRYLDDIFRGCKWLYEIVLPEGLGAIGSYAFAECYRLAKVTIPSSVTRIGQSAFSYCPHLETVAFQGTQEEWNAVEKGAGWFDGTVTFLPEQNM